MNREVMIQDTHKTIQLMLPKLSLTAKDELGTQIEDMLDDFNDLKVLKDHFIIIIIMIQ